MSIKKAISICLCISFIFTSIPASYSQTQYIAKQTLASESFLQQEETEAAREGLTQLAEATNAIADPTTLNSTNHSRLHRLWNRIASLAAKLRPSNTVQGQSAQTAISRRNLLTLKLKQQTIKTQKTMALTARVTREAAIKTQLSLLPLHRRAVVEMLLFFGAITLAGCVFDSSGLPICEDCVYPDTGTDADGQLTFPDNGSDSQHDQLPPDQPQHDQLQPDKQQSDLPQPDIQQPDFYLQDGPLTQEGMQDQLLPDKQQPDMQQPDIYLPDGPLTPDQLQPDQLQPDAYIGYAVKAHSGTVTPDYLSTNTKKVGLLTSTSTSGNTTTISASANNGIEIQTSPDVDLTTKNLQGAWRMEGTSLVQDSTKKNVALTNHGGVTTTAGPGKKGTAANFQTAKKTYLEIPASKMSSSLEAIRTGPVSIGAWINPRKYSKQGNIIAQKSNDGTTATNFDFCFYTEKTSGSKARLTLWDGGKPIHSSQTVSLNTWVHVAFTRDKSGNTMFYINGKKASPKAQKFPMLKPTAPGKAKFLIGYNGQPSTTPWEAYAEMAEDNLQIYDRELSATEVQAMAVDSSNLETNPNNSLRKLDFEAQSNSPLIVRVSDGTHSMDVLVSNLSATSFRSVTIDLLAAKTFWKSKIDLKNIKTVKVLLTNGGTAKIKGLVGVPAVTRPYFGADPDVRREDYDHITSANVQISGKAAGNFAGMPIWGVTGWEDSDGKSSLLENGLGFKINGRCYSALTIGGKIHRPDDCLPLDKIHQNLKAIASKILQRRNDTVDAHEKHEYVNGYSHRQAVLTEFEDNINGLNFADIATVLLEVMIEHQIETFDLDFHRLFIAALLSQGMPLSYSTYTQILQETIEVSIDEEEFDQIIRQHNADVMTELKGKTIYTEGVTADIEESILAKETGYTEFQTALAAAPTQGTIVIDLARFIIQNDTLSTAVTIDTEYFSRFVSFARQLPAKINLLAITVAEQNDPAIQQLLGLLPEDLSNLNVHYGINFTEYLAALLGITKNTTTAVSILGEEAAAAITEPGDLKIIAPLLSDYNRIATIWQEFRTAVDGIDKTKDAFMDLILQIAEGLLADLVAKNQLAEEEKDQLLAEIKQKGIGFIPMEFDPMRYYRSIERMKVLLTAA